MENKIAYIYLISDSTGETAVTMTRAATVHYTQVDIHMVRNKNVRSEEQVDRVIDEAFPRNALIIHTVASSHLRNYIAEKASAKGLLQLDLLGPLLDTLDNYLNVSDKSKQAGILRSVDENYFNRVSAIEFTVQHDDGKLLNDLDQSDIVLVGISRTSKTPLSLFLAHKGWKVANIPLVPHQGIPEELTKIDQRKIVALIIDPSSLQKIRKNRLEKFGQDPGGDYARIDKIFEEIEYAKEIYKQNKRWPVFNVTDKALEETASDIAKLVSSRLGLNKKNLLF